MCAHIVTMVSIFKILIVSSIGAAAAQVKCPGTSASPPNANAGVVAVATTGGCADVRAEMEARIRGTNGWRDPHNDGSYVLLNISEYPGLDKMYTEIATQRKTNPKTSVGGQVYTDKQIFTLAPIPKGQCSQNPSRACCLISSCSESQGSSLDDFSTNFCDIKNLYCGSESGCKWVLHDLVSASGEQAWSMYHNDWSQCIVKKAPVFLGATGSPGAQPKCPGSKAWLGHAKTEVHATAKASCADVAAEIAARAGAGPESKAWVDPHNGGIYSVLPSSSDNRIATQRTTNPKKSVGGQTYTDKQVFTLAASAKGDDSCDIYACSESQGSSLKDFSTNYCDMRNLYCGSADGCKTLLHDFSTTEGKVDASSGQHDFSACIVKPTEVTVV